MKTTNITLAMAALALAACSDDNTTTVTTADGTGEYTIDEDTGDASMTITTPEGDTVMQSGSNVSPDLPDGWSIYPGATVRNAINIGGAEGRGTLVTMEVDASTDAIIDHYRAEAEATGHVIQMELTTNESRIIGGENSSGGTFSVSVVPGSDGGAATVQLTVGQDG